MGKLWENYGKITSLLCSTWVTCTHLVCQIWAQSRSDWSQMGQIRNFFRSDFRTFWRPAPKCSEIWSEKVLDLSHLAVNLTQFRDKCIIPDWCYFIYLLILRLRWLIKLDWSSCRKNTWISICIIFNSCLLCYVYKKMCVVNYEQNVYF